MATLNGFDLSIKRIPAKQQVLKLVGSLPENISYEDIIQTLSICRGDLRAQTDIQEGRYYDTETAKQRVREIAGV
ncbi:hypothetical protein AGMMS50276_17900 [Synergistales bacterium]|nr:hypothetical protein AGMMS50276_17900 [Synergistales bacterium]